MNSYDELKQYDSCAKEYAREKVNYMFHNTGNEHALIICKNLFAYAQSHIRIAANQLYNDEVVNRPEYIESMRNFLTKENARLDILISTIPPLGNVKREHTFYGMIFESKAYKDGRVRIRHARGKAFKEDNGNGKVVNFCTGDDTMYRYEHDVTQRKAIANYNDSGTTSRLIYAFDSVYNELPEVPLEQIFS